MQMPQARSRRTLTRAAAREWLQKLGAEHKPEYATPTRQLYYSSAANSWITVEAARGGNLILATYDACPCDA